MFSPTHVCQDGWNGLITAVLNGHVEAIRLLFEGKADVNAADEVRRVPGYLAARIRWAMDCLLLCACVYVAEVAMGVGGGIVWCCCQSAHVAIGRNAKCKDMYPFSSPARPLSPLLT